jgi:hypothetical protein
MAWRVTCYVTQPCRLNPIIPILTPALMMTGKGSKCQPISAM